jgi:hypothetical protein
MTNVFPKLYIGPMSKNIVDAALKFNDDNEAKVGFIPSRRQIENTGGYVNNWTTSEFSKYVNSKALIQRDHGGPLQGLHEDDGLQSFETDANNCDIVHIDPWKKYPTLDKGLSYTVSTIKHLHSINSDLLYEVGTEEAIRRFSSVELGKLITGLQEQLTTSEYEKIKYAVVQSGVGLDLGNKKNTGTFSQSRMSDMITVCNKYGLSSKEHNGDYLTPEQIKTRYDLGLSAINIAPEFGQIETQCYIDKMSENDMEVFYRLCYNSGKWKKWVSPEFKPSNNKTKLVSICGHYVFAEEAFNDIKPDIDSIVQEKIVNRLTGILNEQ